MAKEDIKEDKRESVSKIRSANNINLLWPNQKSIAAEKLQSSQRDLEDIRPQGPI